LRCVVANWGLGLILCCIGSRARRRSRTSDAESGQVFAGTPDVVVERPTERLAEVAAWRAALHRGERIQDTTTVSRA
jgi:hypothetical protein